MATYYKYKSREGEDQIDWRGITQGITDDMNRIAKERADKKEKIDNEVLTNLETLADKPQGQDAGQNQIIANYAEQASAVALANQKLLKSGGITLKEYTARTNTAGSSTKKLFNLSKKYQENFQRHMDSLKPDENGKIQGSGLGALFLKQVETFSNPDTTRYYMDPTTGEAFLAKVGSDKTTPGQVATIDGKAYSLMDVGAAGDIISRDVNRYQSNDVATNLADQAGAYVDVIMTGDIKTKEDAFARMFAVDEKGNLVEEGITEEGKAIMTQIKATFASDMDYASMLYDTLGKEPIAKDTKGEGYTNILTGKEYTGKVEDAILFETVNGQQQPQITDEQKKEAEMGVLKQIRTKLDIKETARTEFPPQKPPRDTAADKSARALRTKEIGYLKSIDNAISGDPTTAQASIDAMIVGANAIYGKSPGLAEIEDAVRSEDGNTLTVTRIDQDGLKSTTPYDISDPNKAGEVMVELFFPNVKGSYEELLQDFNKQEGGFTTRKIKNPKYDPTKLDDKGLPVEPQFIDNPNYKGQSAAGKTKQKITSTIDFETATVLGDTPAGNKKLKDIIEKLDVGTYLTYRNAPLERSKEMSKGAEAAFSILKEDFPDLNIQSTPTNKGLEIKAPGIFEGTLLLDNKYTFDGTTKQKFTNAIKDLFNSIAKGLPFDVSKHNKK
mgnify:CR=1 FL=1|tara:strand:+ start:5358 stop:7367 length:2010 start_codon:yes stop_codon:yes gene_type:complete